jgi:PAS domain S-box-containing protein
MPVARFRFAGCVAALLLTGAGLAAHAAFGDTTDDRMPILPFVPAVIVAAWIGGLWAGLFASALSVAAGIYAIHTGVPGGLGDAVNLTRLFLFAAGGVGVALVAERAHRWREREEGLRHRAETARQSLDAVVAGIPAPFFMVDAAWRLTAVSDRFAALRGRSRADLIGSTLWERFPDLSGTELERQLRRLAARPGEAAFEARDEASGRWFRHHLYSSEPGVAVLMSDVTDTRRAVDALRHEQEVLQRVINGVPAMITVYDPASRTLRVNREFERVTGYGSADAGAGPVVDAAFPDAAYRASVRELVEAAGGAWIDLRLRARDGRDIETAWAYTRLSDATVVGIGIDETTRRHAEDVAARLAAIVESSEDAIIGLDVAGRITSWNPSAERMFGFRAEEAIGQPIAIIVPPDRRGEEQRVLDALASGARFEHYETVRTTKDGRAVELSLTVSAILDRSGAIVGASKVARDITARKRIEREHENSDRRRNEFLETLAHELRNPLAPIRSSLELLRLSGDVSPTVRHVHEMLERQVRHLVALVDDLVDVSRITHGRIELQRQRFNFSDAVRVAVDVIRPIIEARRQHLTVSMPPDPVPVDGDLARLTQVVTKLLQNATKFTHEGGEIGVDVSRSDGEIVLRVADNGRGIDPEFLPQVFALFAQGDRPSEHESAGLGVGLTLVQQLAELHGGRAGAHSEGIGRGAEFVVRLPASDRPGATRDRASAAPADGPADGRVRLPGPVLVVEDNRDAAESLSLLLQYLGAQVVVAHDGTDALAAISEHQPSVVLLDLGLPGMDGYQVAEMIRAHPLLHDTRLIALTGWGHDEARRRTREAGFEHHLVKPVDAEVLRSLLLTIGQTSKT